MELEWLRIGIAVLGTAAAAAYDVFNNRNVPNTLLYAFVGLGFALNLYAFDLSLFIEAAGSAIVVLALGYLLYKEGQVGGADVLVLAALSLLLPRTPSLLLERQAQVIGPPFIASIFILSGALFLIAFALKNIPVVAKALRKGKAEVSPAGAAYALAALLFLALFANAFGSLGLAPIYMALVGIVVACAAFVIAFKETIISSLIEMVPLKDIEEEDVLAVERMDARVVKRFGLHKLITREELAKLRETRLKRFPILKNLPTFLPYVLVALLLTLKYGDIFSILVELASA